MANFWPPCSLSLFFFLLLPSSLFSFPPLSPFTLPFHLHFLLHYTIYSLKNHFPKLLNLPLLISLNIFLDPRVLGHFFYTPIFVIPISKLSFFFALPMASSSNRPSFLTFNGKKYHPSLDWNDEEGLLQDPKTHVAHSMDFKVRGFFFFLGNLFDFMLH